MPPSNTESIIALVALLITCPPTLFYICKMYKCRIRRSGPSTGKTFGHLSISSRTDLSTELPLYTRTAPAATPPMLLLHSQSWIVQSVIGVQQSIIMDEQQSVQPDRQQTSPLIGFSERSFIKLFAPVQELEHQHAVSST